MTDEQLSALLRLKRFEQPPAQYFDGLLQNIHRRQRAELLQLPLWKIALERMQTFFGEHSMGRLSYAGALASVLVVGVAGIGLMTPGVQRSESQLAVVPPPMERLLNLETAKSTVALGSSSLQTTPLGIGSVTSQPRYIIDARPASFETYAPASF